MQVVTALHPSDPRLLVLRLRCDQQAVERAAAGEVPVQGSSSTETMALATHAGEEEEDEDGEEGTVAKQCEELTSPLVRIMAAAVKGEI